MKRLLPALLPLVCAFSMLRAQEGVDVGGYGEHFLLGYRSQQAYGLEFRFHIKERFTLNYKVGVGPSQQGGIYLHTTAGALAGTWLVANANGNNNLSYLGILLVLVPEGAGMYVGKTDGKLLTEISVNPLGYDYWYRKDPYEEFSKMSGSIEARLKMHDFMKWPVYVAPHVAGVMIYTPGDTTSRFGFRAGISVGYEIKN